MRAGFAPDLSPLDQVGEPTAEDEADEAAEEVDEDELNE